MPYSSFVKLYNYITLSIPLTYHAQFPIHFFIIISENVGTSSCVQTPNKNFHLLKVRQMILDIFMPFEKYQVTENIKKYMILCFSKTK